MVTVKDHARLVMKRTVPIMALGISVGAVYCLEIVASSCYKIKEPGGSNWVIIFRFEVQTELFVLTCKRQSEQSDVPKCEPAKRLK